MEKKNKWKYTYDEYGGYDMMTSAYNIFNEKGNPICEIDTETNGKNKKSENIARLIVDAVNKFLNTKDEK